RAAGQQPERRDSVRRDGRHERRGEAGALAVDVRPGARRPLGAAQPDGACVRARAGIVLTRRRRRRSWTPSPRLTRTQLHRTYDLTLWNGFVSSPGQQKFGENGATVV